MKSRFRLVKSVAALCLLAVSVSSYNAVAGDPPPAPVGTAFTYQGSLTQDGTPFTGSADLTFRLFSDSVGGSQVGSTLVSSGHVVEGGLFTVDLDFGPVFGSVRRWLEIQVDETILVPRQPVMPAPVALFALDGNPGPEGPEGPQGPQGDQGPPGTPGDSHWSISDGNTWYTGGNVGIGTSTPNSRLTVIGNSISRVVGATNTNTNGSSSALFGISSGGIGVHGESNGGAGGAIGVFGSAFGQTAFTYGVWGQTVSPTGAGVYGVADSVSGVSRGVHGHVDSSDGFAGYFTGPAGSRNYFERPVGIGISSPTATLHVATGNSGTGLNLPGLRVFQNATSPNVIGGFSVNEVGGGVHGSTIGGGGQGFNGHNRVLESFATVSGGYANTASGLQSTVSGGATNTASGSSSNIGGGIVNSAGGSVSTVGGGSNNRADGSLSTVGGGSQNIASGGNSTVPGGSRNQAGASYSFAAGRLAKVRTPAQAGDSTGDRGTFVWADYHAADQEFISTGPNQFLIRAGGGVGIGTNAPAQLLSVNGLAGKPGGGSWAVFSDARLKTNIQPLDGSLDRLLSLNGVSFEYTNPESINELPGTRIGMIAQQVEQVFPDWVSDTLRGYKSLSFSGFEALTVEALRDLRNEKDAEIDELRAEKDAEIAALRDEVAALRELVYTVVSNQDGTAR